MSTKAVIADDEKELRSYLRSLLAGTWPELTVCAEAANGNEAVEFVEEHGPQIIFLDIKMPGLTGLEVAEKIAKRCHIVFVTAFDQYAVEAFEREAIDYLVKPVTKDRLVKTVRRLKEQLAVSAEPLPEWSKMIIQTLSKIKTSEKPEFLHWIKTQQQDNIRLIPVADVDYFKAEDKYTVVITREGEALIKKSIKELTQELDPQQFWQIHRAIIVNVSQIEKVSRSMTGRGVLKLKKRSELLTVSRQYLHLFKQM